MNNYDNFTKSMSIVIIKRTVIFFILLCSIEGNIFSMQDRLYANEINKKKQIQNARLFVEAKLAKYNGDFVKAQQFFEECIKYDFNDAASMYELGLIHLAKGKVNIAKEYAIEASKIDPNNYYYKTLLANIYQENGEYDKSIEILLYLIDKNSEKSEYLMQLAFVYVLAQKYDESVEILNELENKAGINEAISLQKHQLYLNMNKTDEAIIEIENLSREYPFETKYYALLAELYIENGLDQKAVWAYNQIQRIDPSDAYVHISLFDFYRTRNEEGKAYNELKQGFANPNLDVNTKLRVLMSYFSVEEIYTTKNKQAKELIWILESVHPNNPRAMALKADFLYRNRELEEARTLLKKVLELEQNQYNWFELLLIIESELGNFKEMIVQGENVIQKFPNQPIPYLVTGLGNMQQKKFSEAEKSYKEGLKKSIGNDQLRAQFYSSLGDLYHETGEEEYSDNAYENALELNSENSVVLNNYAYYLALREKKLDLADSLSKKAVELDSLNASNIDTRAWVLYKLERYEEAVYWIQKAYEIDGGKNIELVEHYGDILYKSGEKTKALKFWKKAKELGNGSKFLDRKIKEKKLIE